MIERLCVIGVGLIGGSLALALKTAGYCREVIGCSREEENLRQAQALGVIDRYVLDPAQAVQGADMVLVAVPLGAMETVFHALAPGLAPDTVVTDAGSSKASVVRSARATLGVAFGRFVPGHPIAGIERSGVHAAFPTLFRDRRVILTPLPETEPKAHEQVRRMWETAGAVVEDMDVEHHDVVLAATSHLPHMLAFGLVDSLARMSDHDDIFRYAAGGFRDFTRIASSDPVMWRDVCLANRDALLSVLARYRIDLDEITAAIARGDGRLLEEIFGRARAARETYASTEIVAKATAPGGARRE
jgi:prephenate dehydrogenase